MLISFLKIAEFLNRFGLEMSFVFFNTNPPPGFDKRLPVGVVIRRIKK